MHRNHPYPIGTEGKPWGDAEKAAWRERQSRQRSYAKDVLEPVEALREAFEVVQYGALDIDPGRYPMFALKTRNWQDDKPVALVTGGVHGYETSGVLGALEFARNHASRYEASVNVMVVPCVSPWGWEMIQRWNPHAVDPNRSFVNRAAQESALVVDLVAPMRGRFLLHIDLHETTDTDETEFRPALAARDGKPFKPGTIPDGFYLVDDTVRPQPSFHKAIIDAVARVTHIAPPDDEGKLIGDPVHGEGIIRYPLEKAGLCAGVTDARYRTTTEVYPDSPRTSPQECVQTQATAVCAGIEFALAAPG